MAKTPLKDFQLTSAKVDPVLHDEFKIISVGTKITLRELVDRSLHLYITDDNFRALINNRLNTDFTGSSAS